MAKAIEAKQQNIHAYVKDMFIKSLEKGDIPWSSTFISTAKPPMNFVRSLEPSAVNRGRYSGINLWIKSIVSKIEGLDSPYWLTPRDVANLGGTVDEEKRNNATTLTHFFRPMTVEEMKGLRKEYGEYYTCDAWRTNGSAASALLEVRNDNKEIYSCGNDFDLNTLTGAFWATRNKSAITKLGFEPVLCDNTEFEPLYSVGRERDRGGRSLLSNSKPEFLGEDSELEGVYWLDRSSVAINADAVLGIPALDQANEALNKLVEVPPTSTEAIDAVIESIDRGFGAEVVNRGNQPRYNTAKDQIIMPDISKYVAKAGVENSDKGKANYYFDLLHELVHSTGHADRIDRLNRQSKDGEDSYAFEELVAEMSASMIAVELGLDKYVKLELSEGYIQGWIKRIEGTKDPKFIVQAASKAEQAVNWIKYGQKYAQDESQDLVSAKALRAETRGEDTTVDLDKPAVAAKPSAVATPTKVTPPKIGRGI